jgi:LysR family nitrogen assimilation transcriptional regulator
MTLVQLANFIRIVELQSVSKAAAIVRIAQPALSRQIRALEQELGAPLLRRHGWGVTPTAAGEALLEHARRVLAVAEAARDAVHSLAAEPTGRVQVGLPNSIAAPLLPALGASLRERYPQLRPHFVDAPSDLLHRRVLSGKLDLAVLYKDRAVAPVVASPLLQEQLMLIGPPGATVDTSLKAGELLSTLPLVLPGRPNRHRLLVEQVAGEGPLDIAIEIDSLPGIIAVVHEGQGFTVGCYSSVATEVERGWLTVFPLRPQIIRTLMLARLDVRAPSAAVAAVAREMCQMIVSLAPAMRWKPLFGSGPNPKSMAQLSEVHEDA